LLTPVSSVIKRLIHLNQSGLGFNREWGEFVTLGGVRRQASGVMGCLQGAWGMERGAKKLRALRSDLIFFYDKGKNVLCIIVDGVAGSLGQGEYGKS
jgi:hypothetical protein